MRILLANEARRGGGGVETYLASIVDPLARRGHDVALLYANPSSEQGPTSIDTKDSWSVADAGVDRAIAAARAWRPDVCFSHNMRVLDVDERLVSEWPTFKMMHGYFGTCLSGHKAFSYPALEPCTRRCGAGCLVHFLPRRCGQLRPDVMLAQYGWAMRQQRLFDRYAGIVVASEHMRGEYLRHDVAAERVHAIPLFVGEDPVPAAAADPPIDVLFVGRLTPLKGPQELLRAIASMDSVRERPALHVVIAGDGPARSALEHQAREIESRRPVSIEFTGWVDGVARSALLARSCVLAVTSLWPEPFGLVGLEGGFYGVPAVGFDVGGVREWLDDGVNGLLLEPVASDALRPFALGKALATVLRDPGLRARLSAGARATAARLSVNAHISSLERLLSCRSTGTS
jgi:glycosyltransferase involved in cell wall biosynthesis